MRLGYIVFYAKFNSFGQMRESLCNRFVFRSFARCLLFSVIICPQTKKKNSFYCFPFATCSGNMSCSVYAEI